METKMLPNNSSLTCKRMTLFIILAASIQIIGLFLFIMGFFPVKPTLSGISGPDSFFPPRSDPSELSRNVSALPPGKLKSLYQELSGVPPLFDRLVLMVIDGLPAEFVLGKDGQSPPQNYMEAMSYTQSLLARKLAIGYHAKAAPPTVTMPRLKAMVSGAIGGFLDVASNFNTQAFMDDNLIGQFLRIGWKMVMLGDDTWLKLFPGMFTRHDGVSSFFVKDTVEVDYNVSRHLIDELTRTDWDLLILHYLGLDHVGHIGGRNSGLMALKLIEMDEAIKSIHSSIIHDQANNHSQTLLMVVSDHGMTENGNHGGSSYEETDSLILFVGPEEYGYASITKDEVYQVDIAATLALLFGVPIPKNNVGTLMPEAFTSLTDDCQLRVLQLNSWQLLRLLQAQLPDLACEKFSCKSTEGRNDVARTLCCLYSRAAALHDSWKSNNFSRSITGDEYRGIVLAYHDFLRTASRWLSSRATDKPISLLASGITAMILSSAGFLYLLFLYGDDRDMHVRERESFSHVKNTTYKWHLEDIFTNCIIIILILSMGSSSMIEEEQYIWYFMTSTLYLILLRKTVQSITAERLLYAPSMTKEGRKRSYSQIYCILVILVSARILRGWHRGGVNWAHLPDISKLLEQAGTAYVKSLQLVSLLLVISISLVAPLLCLRSKKRLVMVLCGIFLLLGLLVLQHILKYQNSILASDDDATTRAQMIYALLCIFTVGTLFSVPWLMPVQNVRACSHSLRLSCTSTQIQRELRTECFRDSIYVVAWWYMSSWCLLQLFLQQPVNSLPILLLLVQILASLWFFSGGDPHVKTWVEVAVLYYVGMMGHFGFGNTNTLATIDVAGAFIGVSSYSTLISGILMFFITYASPLLTLLSMLMYVAMKDTSIFVIGQDVDLGHLLKMTIGYPCLLPLSLNSILLVAYTIMLLLMRNHLFVWSVFSPKYLYVCATTACVSIGVCIVAFTATYVAFATWKMLKNSGMTTGLTVE